MTVLLTRRRVLTVDNEPTGAVVATELMGSSIWSGKGNDAASPVRRLESFVVQDGRPGARRA